jgi:hypothetical protein
LLVAIEQKLDNVFNHFLHFVEEYTHNTTDKGTTFF